MAHIFLTDMDFVRFALANAIEEGMTLLDVWQAVEHAETAEDFNDAVELLVWSGAGGDHRMVWLGDRWEEEVE